MNRYWQMIFGRGIVESSHDFGSQGSLPSHPELLDWLAIELIESGWDIRHLLKMMLCSATYRQSSVITEEHLLTDAANQYLSRGSSYRLQAELIRDHALFASGLLDTSIGGPSVKPYQPEGLWKEKNEFSGYLNTYQPDSGKSLYRKSLYTFIRRTSPSPSMTAFDAPARDVCVLKREKTNTPMQALILLNDPQFVEAARVLAERMQKEGGAVPETQIEYGFQLMCGRKTRAEESELLLNQYQFSLERFTQTPEAAEELLTVGEYPVDHQLDRKNTAALAMVALSLMNFDEAYMKR